MTIAASQAIRPAAALRGTIVLPSDKSIAHRALICGALATGESRIGLRQPGADVVSTMGALRSLGVDVEFDDGVALVAGRERLGAGTADCGNSGTSMRLLAGALASGSGVATLVGDESLSRRPMTRIAEPLRHMGAEIGLIEGHAPVVVRGRRPLVARDHVLSVASAQVVGSICLAGLAAQGTTMVRVPGRIRDHTERMLASLGADIDRHEDGRGTTTTVRGPGGLRPLDVDVPGDFSSASAWLVAGALHADANIRIAGVGLNPTRTALLAILREMGASIDASVTAESAGERSGDVVVRGGQSLRAISLGPDDVAPLIDELPLLAVAMAAADGTSEVRGAAELRIKESDRIATMTSALTAAGAVVEELADGWRIRRGSPLDAQVDTHADHRVAMAMAVAAWTGVASSVVLDDPSCVQISYPSFWEDARSVGALA